MTAPLLELVDVAKRFRRGDVVIEALQGVTFSIERGEFVAIVGASGSGKTTLMNILGCLDRPTAGRYRVRGEDVADLAPAEVARLRRDLFGFVFQTYNLIGSATAIENVEVPAIYAGAKPAERRARAAALLDRLGLAERADHRPSQLSGGQQQRVAIARALMNGGEVIFADEPSGALDSRSGDEVMALLKRLNAEGHTVVLITHNAEVAAAASRIVEIKDGRIVRDTGPRRGPAAAPPPVPVRGRRLLPAFAGEFVESLRSAARSLRAHVFRTVLTLLGIVIGVASVVAMLAVGNGAKQSVLERISWMGSNLLLVRPGGPQSRGGQVATLVPEDAEAIRGLPNVLAAVAEVNGPVTLRYRNVDYQTQATAVTADLPLARAWPVRHGLFFDEDDLKRYAPVAVLGETALVNLFGPDEDPVGRYVLVNNVPFLVIGVMAPKGATPWGADMDDTIFVPLTTGSLRLFGQRHLRTITVLVDELARIDATEQAIWRLLIERHRAEDFRIRNMESVVQAATETQNTLTLMLGSIAAISLLVGGIGVMNIMLISVTERTREIGIRVATGARTANILQQFLTEAVAVSALGGAIGAAGGLGVAWLLAAFGTPIVITPGPVLLAVGCAFATGVIFGFMPARKAAGLDPVVALGFG